MEATGCRSSPPERCPASGSACPSHNGGVAQVPPSEAVKISLSGFNLSSGSAEAPFEFLRGEPRTVVQPAVVENGAAVMISQASQTPAISDSVQNTRFRSDTRGLGTGEERFIAAESGSTYIHGSGTSGKGRSFFCPSCGVQLGNSEEYKLHHKGDWHRYNLRRRLASLPPVAEEVFERKLMLLASAAEEQRRRKGHSHLKRASTGKRSSPAVEKAQDDALRRAASKRNGSESRAPTANKAKCGNSKVFLNVPSSSPTSDKRPTQYRATFSLFDDADEFSSIERCIDYMRRKFSFFIPDRRYLVDSKGLLQFLGDVIWVENRCISCCRRFGSIEAARHHMIAKGHTDIGFDKEEISDFFDFTTSYWDVLKGERERRGPKCSGVLALLSDRLEKGGVKEAETLARQLLRNKESIESLQSSTKHSDVGLPGNAREIVGTRVGDDWGEELLDKEAVDSIGEWESTSDGSEGEDVRETDGGHDCSHSSVGQATVCGNAEIHDEDGIANTGVMNGRRKLRSENTMELSKGKEKMGKRSRPLRQEELLQLFELSGLRKAALTDSGDLLLPNGHQAVHRSVAFVYRQRLPAARQERDARVEALAESGSFPRHWGRRFGARKALQAPVRGGGVMVPYCPTMSLTARRRLLASGTHAPGALARSSLAFGGCASSSLQAARLRLQQRRMLRVCLRANEAQKKVKRDDKFFL